MTAKRREFWTAMAFVSPWIIGFLIFMVYPLSASIYYSFCDYSVLRSPIWIGFQNYTDLVRDNLFWTSLENTFIFAMLALPLGTFVCLSLAMLLNMKVRFMSVYRTIFFLPSLVPTVAMAVLWLWILNGDLGVLNQALRPILSVVSIVLTHLLGPILGPIRLKPPNWLSDPGWTKPALVLLSVWSGGNTMVIYLAGLQDVPRQLYEAADLDGAGWWARTLHVTLPMLSPVILFNVIMGIIGSLQVFTLPYIMFGSGGAPANSTYFYVMYLFDNAFIYHKMGLACAMGWIMFVIIMVLTLASLRASRRHVHYSGG
ncbi:MAG: sugar ABC transporter permease [Armatimonadetes bacterium]|nr:sugar ABC transporter permease [Armatimonadota bacterium]MDE2206257.1 sugar ABC transporter permease [Armatimonadota bacterium]